MQRPQSVDSKEVVQVPGELSSDDFSLVNARALGAGSCAFVYACSYKNNSVAVKIANSNDKTILDLLMREKMLFESFAFRNQKAFGADCIVKYFGHINTLPDDVILANGKLFPGKQLSLVMEQANLGALDTIILGDESNNVLPADLTSRQTRAIVTGIAKGMSALHEYDIIHCDVKLENMLLTQDAEEELHVKIADLGLSKFQYEVMNFCGSPFYLAPEVLRNERQDKKSDVFSMGLTFWEVLERTSVDNVLHVHTYEALVEAVVYRHKRPPICDHFSVTLSQWMRKCWQADPDKRPAASECAIAFNALTDADIEETYEKNFNI